MNNILKPRLVGKITLIILLTTFVSQFVQISSFEYFFKQNHEKEASLKIDESLNNLKNIFNETKKNLIKTTKYINENKSVLASIYFINNYQDKKNYNSILIDEEKKRLLDQLLDSVKISSNDILSIYDKNRDLIAFITKQENKYIQSFISYESSKPILFSKNEYELEYKRKLFKLDAMMKKCTVDLHKKNNIIEYENKNNDILTKIHAPIIKNDSHVGFIHLVKIYDKQFFEDFSQKSNLTLSIDTKNILGHKDKIESLFKITNNINLLQQNNEYIFITKSIPTINNATYLSFLLEKSKLDQQIFENRKIFLIITILEFITIVVLVIFLLKIILIKPLNIIMKQIKYIKETKYDKFQSINTKDELEVILNNLHELSKIIDNREKSLSEVLLYSKTDKKGIITDASDAFCKVSGYSKKELIGSSHNIIRHPDMDSKLYKEIWDTIQAGDTWKGEIKNKAKDGHYYWINSTISPEYNSKGELMGYFSTRRDITAQKDSLKQQQIIAEQAKMVSMGEMIGNIAHQWRQPLSAISIAATGSLQQKEFGILSDESFEKNMNDINKKAQYLSTTIDTFRDFLKAANTKELETQKIQQNISDSINLTISSLKDNFITLKKDICSEDIEVLAPKNELTQVLINIINNAKDILKEKNIDDPWIQLTLTKEKNNAIITIEDNGGGIPKDVLPRIFEAYFTTKHQSQGTGLGLNMSYQIITKSFKGTICAKNSTNGALFTIEIPLNKN